jgi:FKBP-type peptidyl-prolyl cis-trans isomerase FkpA
MNKLNRKEGIAVFVGMGLLAYLLFSGPFMDLFTTPSTESTNITMNNTGFTAQDLTVGTGELAQAGDLITAHYVGRLENGQVFDSSLDSGTPIQFVLGTGRVIRGWDEGIVGMRKGGRRLLTIAPEYAYGANAIGAIPANSTLIFEVELVDVAKTQ